MNVPTSRYTVDEQAALDLVLDTFPGSTVGEFEPLPEPSVLAEADEILAEVDWFAPVVWAELLAEGMPEVEYVEPPYLPRGARVWAFGPAEGGKTIFFQAVAAHITRRGGQVIFVSQENPLATDLDRFVRLGADLERLHLFHNRGLDLAEHDHLIRLMEETKVSEAELIVLDTLSACWSGDESSNAEVVALDRDRLQVLVRHTGATVVVIHHTGHPQAFVNRGGVGAGRGASAMGQKADVILVFGSTGVHEFTVDHAKDRTPGGHKEPKTTFRVLDTEAGGLEIERMGRAVDPRVLECMDAAVEVVVDSDGTFGTNALKAAMAARGFGTGTFNVAVAELKIEDPARIRQNPGLVIGPDGRRRKGKPWASAC